MGDSRGIMFVVAYSDRSGAEPECKTGRQHRTRSLRYTISMGAEAELRRRMPSVFSPSTCGPSGSVVFIQSALPIIFSPSRPAILSLTLWQAADRPILVGWTIGLVVIAAGRACWSGASPRAPHDSLACGDGAHLRHLIIVVDVLVGIGPSPPPTPDRARRRLTFVMLMAAATGQLFGPSGHRCHRSAGVDIADHDSRSRSRQTVSLRACVRCRHVPGRELSIDQDSQLLLQPQLPSLVRAAAGERTRRAARAHRLSHCNYQPSSIL